MAAEDDAPTADAIPGDWKALTPSRMRILPTLAETKSVAATADRLGITPTMVRRDKNALDRIFHHRLFQSNQNYRKGEVVLTEFGQYVAGEMRDILNRQINLVHGSDRPLTVMSLPHHTPFVAPALKDATDAWVREGLPAPAARVLGEHHRAMSHFMERAIRPLVAGSHDLVVGLKIPILPEYAQLRKDVDERPLYTAWLEVMVAKDKWPEDRYPIQRLHGIPILTAPYDTRSRMALDAAFTAATRPGASLLVAGSEYESKVLIMKAKAGLGTPVLPSDVALQFEEGGPLGGTWTESYKWVPLITPGGNRLHYTVVASTRAATEKPTDFAKRVQAFSRLLANFAADTMIESHRPEALPRYRQRKDPEFRDAEFEITAQDTATKVTFSSMTSNSSSKPFDDRTQRVREQIQTQMLKYEGMNRYSADNDEYVQADTRAFNEHVPARKYGSACTSCAQPWPCPTIESLRDPGHYIH
ncbi:LysR family transcriptional regulator [Nocardia sp. GCM10030253]|uniref:LysR family transcriptional regulator n=1 Tax=Nocardia sp. GCM10030253 TaxID=3273404 RepID=UPI00362536CD